MSAAILAAARREQILAEIGRARCVNVTDLSRRFGVSYMTVRRDLDLLAKAGRLTRVHGGALPSESPPAAPGSTRPRPSAADVTLAAAAARQVVPGTTVALARGPRSFALAGFVAEMPSVKVVTNSLWVAQFLHERGRASSTFVTGGIGTPGGGLAGPALASALREVLIDTVFVDAEGADARAGLTAVHFADATADATLIAAAAKVVVMVPSALWGMVNLCHVAGIDTAHTIITDQLTARMRDDVSRSGVRVVSIRRPAEPTRAATRSHPSAAIARRRPA